MENRLGDVRWMDNFEAINEEFAVDRINIAETTQQREQIPIILDEMWENFSKDRIMTCDFKENGLIQRIDNGYWRQSDPSLHFFLPGDF